MTRTTSLLVTGMLTLGLTLGLMFALGTSARAEDEPSPSLTTLMERLAKLEAENAKLHARITQLETRPHRRPGRHQIRRPGAAEDAAKGEARPQPIAEDRPEGRRPGPREANRGPRQGNRGRARGGPGQGGTRGPDMRGRNQGRHDRRGPGPRGPGMRGPGQHGQPGPGGPGNSMDARLTRIEHMLHQLLGKRGPAAGQGRRVGRPRGRPDQGVGPQAPRPPAPPTGPRPPMPKKSAPPAGDGDAKAPVPAPAPEASEK